MDLDEALTGLEAAGTAQIDRTTVEDWCRDLEDYVVTDAFAALVVDTPFADDAMIEWIDADGEWVEALEVAERIGTVDVDHGETGCKTAVATAYIPKARQRQRKKELKTAAST